MALAFPSDTLDFYTEKHTYPHTYTQVYPQIVLTDDNGFH